MVGLVILHRRGRLPHDEGLATATDVESESAKFNRSVPRDRQTRSHHYTRNSASSVLTQVGLSRTNTLPGSAVYTAVRSSERHSRLRGMVKESDNQLAYLVSCGKMCATASNSRHSSGVPTRPTEQDSERPLILEVLPTELLTIIFLFLHADSVSVHAVRRTCVLFRDAAWSAFGHTFNRKVFHLSKGSLDCLSELASKERTASYVTQLNLSTVTFDALKGLWDWCEYGRDAEEMHQQSVHQQHLDYMAEDVRLEAQGWLREQLEEAMKGLPKLETIVIVDGENL